jgi:hypothetical protein
MLFFCLRVDYKGLRNSRKREGMVPRFQELAKEEEVVLSGLAGWPFWGAR